MKNYFVCNSPIGKLTIVECGGVIMAVKFGEHPDGEYKNSVLIQNAVKQLTQYFDGSRTAFDLPLMAEGTDFQKRVWDELKKIPYGETRSYGQIASSIGNPKAVRAVGGANNKNPIAIIVPCHRVIGSGGTLVGYAGGLNIKEMLLELEQQKGHSKR